MITDLLCPESMFNITILCYYVVVAVVARQAPTLEIVAGRPADIPRHNIVDHLLNKKPYVHI